MIELSYGLLALSVFALGFFAVGARAALRHVRERSALLDATELPPVSILKPLKGVEESLEANLRSFFQQDHPCFEIVFATSSEDDPALPIARALAAEHPEIPTRFVRSDPSFGLNPKVANLRGALAASRYELVLQSDANVRAAPDYLRRITSEIVERDGAILSSLVVGVGERSLGAAMENLQLSAMIAPACAFALHYFDVPCVIGKSMLFYKRDLARVGGLESVKDVLAEDYLLGRALQAAGRPVILSATTAENVNEAIPIERFVARHARWLKMRAVIHPPAFIADLFANPVGLVVLAILASGFEPRVASIGLLVVLAKLLLDRHVVAQIRGAKMALRHALAAPLKDLLLLAIFPYAAVSRSIVWRGVRLRIGWGTRLHAEPAAASSRPRGSREIAQTAR